MARNMAHSEDTEPASDSDTSPAANTKKLLLNRREYTQVGAAAAATLLASGSTLVGDSVADGNSNSFSTDFSEYAR